MANSGKPGVEASGLGKRTRYDSVYDPSLLFPISREDNRSRLRDRAPDMCGEDWWTCYELSWLSPSGLPLAGIAHFRIPLDSPQLIESKSFKLYLNSLNQQVFESLAQLEERVALDLSQAAGAPVGVNAVAMPDAAFPVTELPRSWQGIDSVSTDERQFKYVPDAGLLCADPEQIVEEQLYSDLLRSNCPVTDQPDWGSIFIDYRGPKIDRESLLRYIVSYRQCQDFHEHCVEQIFCDVLAKCACESLSVYARYTRRGGLDINPYRATPDKSPEAPAIRTVRQ